MSTFLLLKEIGSGLIVHLQPLEIGHSTPYLCCERNSYVTHKNTLYSLIQTIHLPIDLTGLTACLHNKNDTTPSLHNSPFS